MSTQTNTADSSAAFQIGWIVLLSLSAMATLWLILLMFTFVDDAPVLMTGAAVSLYTTLILSIPFRRGEKWAWYATWIQVILFASTIFFGTPEITMKYLVAAGLMALCLLFTGPAFFQRAP
ncbi:MAG TPA: hypothetical protein VJM08_16415 [Anaerolineales bacterium]|nr:hypothetical protein [Anaerolineales bacterium]